MAHVSPWSPCSTSCGLGISTRVSNANARCWPEQESRLCNLRPCDADIRPLIKVGPTPGQRCWAGVWDLTENLGSEPGSHTSSWGHCRMGIHKPAPQQLWGERVSPGWSVVRAFHSTQVRVVSGWFESKSLWREPRALEEGSPGTMLRDPH